MPIRCMSRKLFTAALLGMLVSMSGCATVEYAHHAWQGQREVSRASVPVQDILADPQADAMLKARLSLALEARRFASEELGLPDNASYTRYVALPHNYVLWNIFVTPELSLRPVEHCYPFAGCMAYKGFFDEQRTQREAQSWRDKGHDVHTDGVPAYSTLGMYDDPILSSMLHWNDDYLAELIFHELAHQQFYVRDDTAFNESFATFIGQEGMRRWRAEQGLPPPDAGERRMRSDLVELIMRTRDDLQKMYASDLDDAAKREGKAQRFEQLKRDYETMRDERWNGDRRFDPWFSAELNNASLLPFGLYDQWVPAFEALFEENEGDWNSFYQAVRELGGRKPEAREAALLELNQRKP